MTYTDYDSCFVPTVSVGTVYLFGEEESEDSIALMQDADTGAFAPFDYYARHGYILNADTAPRSWQEAACAAAGRSDLTSVYDCRREASEGEHV